DYYCMIWHNDLWVF
nr:immunoglobulin light chain junction region [Macaca mulatta]MOX45595.1 immunoglobulin light chain junction region [Macaca mulatta]